MLRGVALVPALTIVLAVVLTGCGGSSENIASKSAGEILAASRTAALSASSVGVVDEASQGRLSVATRLQLARDGGRGSLSFLGLRYEALRVGNTLYVKGDPVFYRRLAKRTGAHVPPGAWVKAPVSGSGLASYAGLTDMGRELGLLLNTGRLVKGATTTIDGQQAIELKTKGKLYSGAIYIATTGVPYPLQIVRHGRENAKTTFSGWNEPVTLTAPAGAVELSGLEHHNGG